MASEQDADAAAACRRCEAEISALLQRAQEALKEYHSSGDGERLKTEREAVLSGSEAAVKRVFALEMEVIKKVDIVRDRVRHRQHVVEEMHATEAAYLSDLEAIDKVWAAEVTKENLLSLEDRLTVFGPVGQLLALSGAIVQALGKEKEKPPAEQRVGEAFKAKVPFLKLYIEYCERQERSNEIVAAAMEHSKFRDHMERLRMGTPALRQLDLRAFLIKPTQRIAKYPLFLRDLIEHTDESHPDYLSLVQAADEMKKVLTEINKRTKERATLRIIASLQPNLIWHGDTGVDLLLSYCRVVEQGKVRSTVTRRPPNPGAPQPPEEKGNCVFLFNSVMIVCKKSHGKKRWMELATLFVSGMTLTKDGGNIVLASPNAPDVTVVLTPENDFENRRWAAALNDALSADPLSSAPVKTFDVPGKEKPMPSPREARRDVSDSPSLLFPRAPPAIADKRLDRKLSPRASSFFGRVRDTISPRSPREDDPKGIPTSKSPSPSPSPRAKSPDTASDTSSQENGGALQQHGKSVSLVSAAVSPGMAPITRNRRAMAFSGTEGPPKWAATVPDESSTGQLPREGYRGNLSHTNSAGAIPASAPFSGLAANSASASPTVRSTNASPTVTSATASPTVRTPNASPTVSSDEGDGKNDDDGGSSSESESGSESGSEESESSDGESSTESASTTERRSRQRDSFEKRKKGGKVAPIM